MRQAATFRSLVWLIVLVPWVGAGCESRSVTGSPVLVDPESVSPDSGATDEIYQVADNVVTTLLECSWLDPDRSYRVVLERIINATGIPEYDARIFYNRLLARLTERTGRRFVFLERDAAFGERRRREAGAVTGGEGLSERPAGADLILRIELLGLRGTRTQTVQYNVKLITLDGEIACAHEDSFVKRR